MKLLMLVKDLNVKTLVSGDKSARVTLETLYPRDIVKVAALSDIMEVEVEFSVKEKKDS